VTLKHLGLWDLKVRSQPKVKLPSVTISIDYSDSQVPFSAPSFYPDPDYPTDYNRISKPPWVTSMVMVSAIFGAFLKAERFRFEVETCLLAGQAAREGFSKLSAA
jgi:hypothetical protein